MGWGTINIGTPVYNDSAGATLSPTLSGYSAGDTLIGVSGEFIGSDTHSAPSGYSIISPNASAKQVIICARAALSSSDTLPTFSWPNHGAAAVMLSIPGGPASISGIVDVSSDRQSTSTSAISQTGASVTPTGSGRYVLRVGCFVKTSARDGATITPPTNFTHLVSLVRAGNVVGLSIEGWLQGAATAVPTTGATTSSSESVAQNYEGIVVALIAGTGGSNLLLPSGFRGGMIDMTGGF